MKDMVEVIRCKDCRYFFYNKPYVIDGFPLMGNLVCTKWGEGCRTDEYGYCFMGEKRTAETYEVKDGVRIKI